MLGKSFLTKEERELFSQPGRLIPRSVTRREPFDVSAQRPPVLLTEAVFGQTRDLNGSKGDAFRCCVISVRDGDGCSWAAEAVSADLARRLPHYEQIRIGNRVLIDDLPWISCVVGVNPFLRLAAKHKLTTQFRGLRSWLTMAVLAGGVIAGAAVETLKQMSKAFQNAKPAAPQDMMRDPWLWAPMAGAALVEVIRQFLNSKLTSDTKSKAMEHFRSEFSAKQPTDEFTEFATEVAARLRKMKYPRLVIVDDYESLDAATKTVLETYVKSRSAVDKNAELWVLFEPDSGPGVHSSGLLDNIDPTANKQITFYMLAPLTVKERERLAACIGAPEQAMESTVVKQLCAKPEARQSHFRELFQRWRADHPPQPGTYGELEVLFLLALTSAPGKLYLRTAFLSSRLSESRNDFAGTILKSFLCGGRLEATELTQRFARMLDSELQRAVVFEEDGYNFRVHPDAAAVLSGAAPKLGLPDPALGHLFWALFWRDTWKRAPLEPFWIRKIVYHLALADAAGITDEAAHKEALHRLLELNIDVFDDAIESCLFAELPGLAQRALWMYRDAEAKPANRRVLLNLAWTAYAAIGDTRPGTGTTGEPAGGFIAVLRDLYSLTRTRLRKVAADEDSRYLTALFVDSLPLSAVEHELFRSTAVDWFMTASGEAARDHAMARAAWLAVTVSPLVSQINDPEIGPAIKASVNALSGIGESACERLGSSNSVTRLMDLSTLSIVTWCDGLTACFGENTAGNAAGILRILMGQEASARLRDEQLAALVTRTNAALAVAESIRASETAGSTRHRLFSRALAREVCAVSGSSLLMACHHLHSRHQHEFAPEMIEAISGVFRTIGSIFPCDLPEVRTAEDLLDAGLVNRIEALLRVCIGVWETFGVSQMSDFLRLRRAQFIAIARRLKPSDYAGYRVLTESIGSVIDGRGFTSLLGNCILADSLEPAAELAAHYTCRAAEIAATGKFAPEFKYSFALIAIARAHALGFDLKKHLDVLLEGSADGGRCFLEKYLSEVGEDELCGHALRLLNAMGRTRDHATGAALRAVILKTAGGTSDECRREVQALIDAYSLEASLRSDAPISTAQILSAWEERKNLWLFPWVLDLLLQNGHRDDEVRHEALQVLDRNPADDEFNSYYLLAVALAETVHGAEDEEVARVARGYLKATVERWEGGSTAEMNIRVYTILLKLDRERRELYLAEILKWQAVYLHRQHLTRLPELVKAGEFFVIFKDHCTWMHVWGLDADIDADALNRSICIPAAGKRTAVAEWKAAGGQMPRALIKSGGGLKVGSQFLILGSFLFSSTLGGVPEYAEDRRRFNDAAMMNITELLRVIVNLPGLPPAIRQLLTTHANRLYDFSVPADKSLIHRAG